MAEKLKRLMYSIERAALRAAQVDATEGEGRRLEIARDITAKRREEFIKYVDSLKETSDPLEEIWEPLELPPIEKEN